MIKIDCLLANNNKRFNISADCSWLIWLIAWLMATPGSSRMPCASRWKLEMSDWGSGRVEVEVVSVIRSLPYWSHSADFFRSFCSPSSLRRLWCQTFLASGVFCSRVTAGLMGSVLTCALGLTIDDRLAYASPYITEDEKLLLLNDAWRGRRELREGSGRGGGFFAWDAFCFHGLETCKQCQGTKVEVLRWWATCGGVGLMSLMIRWSDADDSCMS